jgi:thiosulfate dehydrogenase [quinone] large subunit
MEGNEEEMSTLRRYVTPLAILAAAILLYVEAPFDVFGLQSLEASKDVENVLTLIFWVLSIVVIAALFTDRKRPGAEVVEVEGPAFTRYLFSNTRAGLFWLPIRIFLGFAWLEAGVHKATGTGWLDGGKALEGFWTAAVAIPEKGRPPISFEWYRDFINLLLNNHAASWFSYLIVFGEIAIGLGLLVGALVGIAAFFGALMNMSFLLAGSASTNPVLFTFAIGLILAWRVAGYYGLDRYLLPMLGVPWRAKVAKAAPEPVTA